MGLARHESDFEAAAEARVELDELLGALRAPANKSARRREAIARCLSGSDGWRDAAASLGGAFAPLGEPTGLTADEE